MTITYSLWDGNQLLSANMTANSADEMNKVVADLQKVSKNVVAHMRKVTQN
jgi:methyl-accepting chemotaxis protein